MVELFSCSSVARRFIKGGLVLLNEEARKGVGGAVANSQLRRYRGGLGPARLRTVKELVHARIEDELTLSEMAQSVELSTSHFSRLFRKSTGETPHQFVLRHRIERAKEMLRAPEGRVLDVAVACGFKTQQHFARVFRRICGASPTEYRQEWEARSPSEQHRTTIQRMDLSSLLQ
jgi:AraC family transcriptional regulator